MRQQTNRKGIAGDKTRTALYVSTISIIVNISLTLIKFTAGFTAKSEAIISDAVHTASDVFSTIIVIIGVVVSGKNSDTEHQYGHERLECVASILLAFLLAVTGFGIGMRGIEKLIAGRYGNFQIPGITALAAAAVSIVVKEWMYWFTRAAAKKINSGALMADAWHHRSDSLSSVGAFAGILGARLGFPVLDPAVSIMICFFIEKASYQIFMDAMNKMIDRSCSAEKEAQMRRVILDQPGVENIDLLKTRLFGSKMYVDVEFSMNGSLSLTEAHKSAEAVHEAIEKEFPEVKHCMVHVNPMTDQTKK